MVLRKAFILEAMWKNAHTQNALCSTLIRLPLNTTSQKTKPEVIYILLFILLAALWGGSFVAIKEVINAVPPVRGAFYRVVIGIITMLVINLFNRRAQRLSLKLKLKSMLVGIFSIGIPFSFLFTGEKYISAGLAGVLNGTVPIWTLLIALLFIKSERVNIPLKILGAVIGVLGIVVISYSSIAQNAHGELIGVILLLGMAISYGIGTNLSKIVMTGGGHPLQVSLYQHLSALFFLFFATFFMSGEPFSQMLELSTKTYLAIGYLGIFSTGIAFTLFFYLMRQWSATQVSTVTFVIPVFSLLFDFLFFGSFPGFYEMIGTGIIFMSLAVVYFANKNK